MAMLHPVVLSGGSGTRLWPLSRQNQPKQFLALIGDHSLFQETVLRASRLPGAQPPVTVCSEDHRFMVGEQLQEIGIGNGGILLEPMARNTAPAIALAALHLVNRDADATMLVMPADHLIEDETAFRSAVERATLLAASDWLVTFGIHPDYPETGYGYIRQGEALGDEGFRIERFVEKPDRANAEKMLATGGFYWNSGTFMLGVASFLDEVKTLAPETLAAAEAAGMPISPERLLAYGRHLHEIAEFDLDRMPGEPHAAVEYTVLGTALYEPVILALRRLAHQDVAARRGVGA